jgi:hypothetical protein
VQHDGAIDEAVDRLEIVRGDQDDAARFAETGEPAGV